MSKDKRTYKKLNEHGEDISHENEVRQALYKEVKNLKTINEEHQKLNGKLRLEISKLNKEKEKIFKDQDIKNDQHTIEILEKDVEINKLKKSQCKCASVQSVKKDQL